MKSPTLQGIAQSLLPTLTASSATRGKASRGKNAQGGPSLQEKLLPTLCARDEKGPGPAHTRSGSDLPQAVGGHLSPTFCEWFMGFPVGFTEPIAMQITKDAARKRAQRAIKATRCEDCGATDKKLERHHPDHQKPLDVVILCTGCHIKADQDLGNRTVRPTLTCVICAKPFADYTKNTVKTCSEMCLKQLGAINARKRWDPLPAETIASIQALRAQGLSERAIAQELSLGRTALRAVPGSPRSVTRASRRKPKSQATSSDSSLRPGK